MSIDYAKARETMVEQQIRPWDVLDARVLETIASVPREAFVPATLRALAYADTALPLGFQQSISQPYVVARMIEAVAAGRSLGKTLEVGTGCGYQAAVLSHLATDVYTVERIAPLLERAKRTLRHLRLPNVRLKLADGNFGLPEAAPFETIVVAAAAAVIPPALLVQLAPAGRLMMPVGRPGDQQLLMVERRAKGFSETRLDPVRFVPLVAGVE